MFTTLFAREGISGEKEENIKNCFFVEGYTQVFNSLFNTF